MEYEVGVVRKGVLAMIVSEGLRVWRTYRFAKAKGVWSGEWYGVYEKGTEIVVANCGPLPGAHERASRIVDALTK